MRQRQLLAGLAVSCAALVAACSGGSDNAPATAQQAAPSASTGQVGAGKAYKASYYAAARFAEQATFGPTPALVEELRTKGFAQWIDEQFAQPLVLLDAGPTANFSIPTPVPPEIWNHPPAAWIEAITTAPDQLRRRLVWSLSQFVVAAALGGDAYGHVQWINFLHKQAFGNYRTLLRDATIHPHMGQFLNNDQNRPKSAECPHCAPNENYARELMQLFSIGVLKLNTDGTPIRDAQGRFVETYTQRDVEELARVLTGWTYDPNPPNRPNRNYGNWDKPMVPSTWPPERDAGRKEVLGRTFWAGQDPYKDLDDAIDLLVTHPNAAPFVSIRLIQHLVKSDPSPAYVARVAQVFRNNGSGVVGDLKAVAKAILLDPEARRGDDPDQLGRNDGKFREPFMHHMAFVRGLGCQRNLANPDGTAFTFYQQQPFRPQSVFSYYAPTDRAPGSNLLAPEQKLVNASVLSDRFAAPPYGFRNNGPGQPNTSQRYLAAGCNIEEFSRAFGNSPKAFMDLVSLRFFRGAMPPTLRSYLEQLIREQSGNRRDPEELAMLMLGFALASPYYGVIK
jgi:uncharacterized protein (DUF1800 family)